MKTDKKIADDWPFLALFQGKNSVLSYVVNSFWDDPFLFGLNPCMTQQNKGVVSKNFLQHKKKQSCLPWNKVKAPKRLAIWSFSSSGSSRSSSSSSSSRSSSSSKRRKRYTKYTEEKEAEDENWQKKCVNFLHLFGF